MFIRKLSWPDKSRKVSNITHVDVILNAYVQRGDLNIEVSVRITEKQMTLVAARPRIVLNLLIYSSYHIINKRPTQFTVKFSQFTILAPRE